MNRSRTLRLTILSLLLAINAAGASLFAQTHTSGQSGHGIDLKSIATTVRPCQNFYEYANGHWLERNPIPADRSSWGAGSELYEKNLAVLHKILETVAKDTSAPPGSAARKVADFYRTGMDEAKIESEGAKPLAAEFARIAALKDAASL